MSSDIKSIRKGLDAHTLVIGMTSFLLCMGCSSDANLDIQSCATDNLLTSFKNEEGIDYFIYADGKLYTEEQGECTFLLNYFEPDFLHANYVEQNDAWFLSDGSFQFPTKNAYLEDFENSGDFADLFIQSYTDTDLYWDAFTLQSPATPSVPEYNALRQCILAGTCDFIDHRIERIADPTDAGNRVLRLNSLEPAEGMITCKTSISSSLGFFQKGDDLWFSARYYLDEGLPFSLVDFENGYFEQHPGPRVVIREGRLELENKFADKINYSNTSGITLPQGEWVTIKVHLRFSEATDGVIQIWQDDQLVIDTTGINLPTANSLQNILEVGITATSEACVLLVDDIRISRSPF